MRMVTVHLEGLVDMSSTTPDELEACLDIVMAKLEELGAPDPAIGGTLVDGRFEIELAFPLGSPQEALRQAQGMINQALAAARLVLTDNDFEEVRARRELVTA